MLIKFGEKKKNVDGNSLVVQWLGLCAVSAESLGSIPSWGTNLRGWVAWLEKKNVDGQATVTGSKSHSIWFWASQQPVQKERFQSSYDRKEDKPVV